MFCRSLFVLLYFFFWPLCCLYFFDVRILIAPLVSSNSSCGNHRNCKYASTCNILPMWLNITNLRLTRRVLLVEQELITLPEHLRSPLIFKVKSSNPVHGEVYSIQHYVKKFVSDLRQVGGFLQVLRYPPTIKLTATI